MSKGLPLVSFCIPVHNAAPYLRQTIDSILAQDYPNIEIVCVNDHSCDDSGHLLQSYGAKLKVFEAQKRGAAAARNTAYAHSEGAFVQFFDADDLIEPDFIATQMALAIEHSDCAIVSKWGRFHDDISSFQEDSFIVKEDLNFYEWIIRYWTYNRHMTPPGRVLLSRATIQQAGYWNEALSLNDDLDFFARAFACAKKIVFNNDGCFFYRSGIGGLSSKTKGFSYQSSNFCSVESATDIALKLFPNDPAIKQACANMWQMFIYDNYPFNTELVVKAEHKIALLGKADFPFPAGGYTKKLSNFIGWKATKRLKCLLGSH